MPLLEDMFKRATAPKIVKQEYERRKTQQRVRRRSKGSTRSKTPTRKPLSPHEKRSMDKAFGYYAPRKDEQLTAKPSVKTELPKEMKAPPQAPSIYEKGQPLEGRQGQVVSPNTSQRIEKAREITENKQVEVVKTYSKEDVLSKFNFNESTAKQIGGFPEGTRFKETEKGFKVILPEDVALQRTKKELREIDQLPPGLREVSQVGYFATQSMYSVAKPVFNFFGKGKEFDQMTNVAISSATQGVPPGYLGGNKKFLKSVQEGEKLGQYGVHYPSTMDYVFEPIGWSPKGSTDILKKYPVTSTIGGVGGEIVQGIAFTGVGMGIKKGVVGGTKILVKKGSQFIGRTPATWGLSKPFGQTAFGQNLMKWTRGYRPAKIMKSVPVENVVYKTAKEGGEQTSGFIKRMYKKVGQREFLPESEFKRFRQKMLLSGKDVVGEIPRGTQVGKLSEKTTFKKVPLRNRYVETYQFTRTEYPRASIMKYSDDVPFGKGRFAVDDPVKPWVEAGVKKVKKNPYQEMLEQGYSRSSPIVIMEQGGAVDTVGARVTGYPGFGSGYRWGIKKSPGQWRKPAKSLLGDTDATASLINRGIQKSAKKIRKPSPSWKNTFVAPSPVISSASLVSLGLGSYLGSKVIQGSEIQKILQQQQRTDPILKQRSRRLSRQDQGVDQVLDQGYDELFKPVFKQQQKQVQELKTDQVMKQDSAMIMRQMYKQPPDAISSPKIKIPPFMFFPDQDDKTTEKLLKSDDLSSLGYRQRKWKVPSIDDILGG